MRTTGPNGGTGGTGATGLAGLAGVTAVIATNGAPAARRSKSVDRDRGQDASAATPGPGQPKTPLSPSLPPVPVPSPGSGPGSSSLTTRLVLCTEEELDLSLAAAVEKEQQQRLLCHKHIPDRDRPAEVTSDTAEPRNGGRATPLHLDTPLPSSGSGVPGSPKSLSLQSFRLTDDDSVADELPSPAVSDGAEGKPRNVSVPELVMPSMIIPQRRPCTENGKRLGRVRMMVVGDDGRTSTTDTGLRHGCVSTG